MMANSSRQILLIDDDADFRDVLSTRLKAEGFDVSAVASGEEGLIVAADRPFDLVLIDWLMPDQDGVETYHALRENANMQHVPIILLTGAAVEGRWEPMEAETDSRAYVLGKPYDHTTLIARIHQVLSEAGGE